MPRFHRATFGLAAPAVWAGLICLAIGGSAHAQDPPPPAYISFVEGAATLERNGESEPAIRDMPFVQGDRLRTESGRAEIQFPDGTAIEIGEYSLVEAVTPSRVRLLAGTMDHVQGRAAEAPTAMSAAYLPQDLQAYGNTFDRNGSWQYAAPYGYVWYPTVEPGWRPYFYGSWSAVPSYGWTWIGIDAWSWPTHHYGRWGYGRNAWYWIPGRTWGAAWVSWGAAPNYVSWCPLGYDGRPVFGLSVIAADFGSRYRDHGWNGWTVMSRRQFGVRGQYAHRNAVEPRQLPSNMPFIAQSRAPVGLPHQSSVAGRQSSVTGRQSSVGSRQSQVGSQQSSVTGRQSPVGSHQSAVTAQPLVASRPPSVAMPRDAGGVAVPRRDRPVDQSLVPMTTRPAPSGDGVVRRAYPIAAPAAPETPSVTVSERPRMYPLAAPRSVHPWSVQQPAAPAYQPAAPGYRVQPPGARQAEPQRWNPPSAMPRSAPPPVQQTPAAAPSSVGSPPVQSPAPAPPARAEPHTRTPPPGAAQEGGARQRSAGDGQPAGARHRR